MPSLNTSLIGSLQSRTMEDKLKNLQNGADIDYLGHKKDDRSSVTKYGYDANVNRVLFWLSSKTKDYVRQPDKGGILYSLIGTLNSDSNLQDWEKLISEKFNQEFSRDLTLVLVKLVPDNLYRKLSINMIIRDNLTNNTFSLSTGVQK